MSQWTRREMLRATGASVATLALSPLSALAQAPRPAFTLPPLPYAADALEPSIDKQTMEIHHGRHHAAYVNNLNAAVAKHPALRGKTIEEILRDIASVPAAIRQAVVNNGGGHSNHSIFWTIMGPRAGGAPTGMLAKAIDGRFESFEKFRTEL